jgi:DNA-binding FrmR family transcriptional regulator
METKSMIPVNQRLLSAGGHIKAVTAMVKSNVGNEIVLFQLCAIQNAIKAISRILVEESINEYFDLLLSSSSSEESQKALDSLLSLYKCSINQY